ncbi:MAG: hypothetical protein GY782_05145 [Gammaproteobacteria bacterium]|nr:hypothetical protein [Gammaproteobacteria bacterium]
MISKLNDFYDEVKNIRTTKRLLYPKEMHYLAGLFLAWFDHDRRAFVNAYPEKINVLTIQQCRNKAIMDRPCLLQDKETRFFKITHS